MVDQIDPNVEESVRVLIGCLLETDHDELERTLDRLIKDEPVFLQVMTLVGRVATLAIVRRCGDRAPTDEEVATIAADITQHDSSGLPLEREDVNAFITRVLFGGEPFDAVMESGKSVLVPLIVTARLLASSPEYKSWHRYLDVLESGLEQSGGTSGLTSQDPNQT